METCGLTKPTRHHHFGSKAGLLETLMETEGRPRLESLRRAAEYGHDILP